MPSFDETAEYKAQLVSALHLAWNDAAEHARLYKENMKVQYDKTARPSLIQIKKFLDPTGPASTLPGIPEEEASFTPPNGGETVDEESHEISERSVSDTPVQQHPRLPSHGYNLRSTRKQQ
ncbi:hypothetical protein ANCDUO_08433 [Ancylostoma duodenale]|uniref:Uncharacterized protein n=1 Tax=Ancylostoma duodenale TaxID=51022 RepID=A0A0C2GQB8_9BILA|nr:hypothetical protein ANCDUO_08433 [Ancylostoma duodenale]